MIQNSQECMYISTHTHTYTCACARRNACMHMYKSAWQAHKCTHKHVPIHIQVHTHKVLTLLQATSPLHGFNIDKEWVISRSSFFTSLCMGDIITKVCNHWES